jgi:hypothetical protein
MDLHRMPSVVGRWRWHRVVDLKDAPHRPQVRIPAHGRGALSPQTQSLREWLEADSLDWDAVESARTEAWGS